MAPQRVIAHELPFFLNIIAREESVTRTVSGIFLNNLELCSQVSRNTVHTVVSAIESNGRRVSYLNFLQSIVKAEGQTVRNSQNLVMDCLYSIGEEDLLFYNDEISFAMLVKGMQDEAYVNEAVLVG